MGYIDDPYLQGDTIHECQNNITDTFCLFQELGFIIHPVKSMLRLVQTLFIWVCSEFCQYDCVPAYRKGFSNQRAVQ